MGERTIRTHSDREWRALTKAMQRGADRMPAAEAKYVYRWLDRNDAPDPLDD